MTSQADKQIITIHILPNISRSKDNQTVKFGQLIEYNMGNIFLEKLYAIHDKQSTGPKNQDKNLNILRKERLT